MQLISVKKQFEDAKKAYNIELENLVQTYDKEKDLLSRQAAADLKSAVSDARQDERDKAMAKIEKYQDTIESYRKKIDEQNSIIANLNFKLK